MAEEQEELEVVEDMWLMDMAGVEVVEESTTISPLIPLITSLDHQDTEDRMSAWGDLVDIGLGLAAETGAIPEVKAGVRVEALAEEEAALDP